jgi:hypothetical protein
MRGGEVQPFAPMRLALPQRGRQASDRQRRDQALDRRLGRRHPCPPGRRRQVPHPLLRADPQQAREPAGGGFQRLGADHHIGDRAAIEGRLHGQEADAARLRRRVQQGGEGFQPALAVRDHQRRGGVGQQRLAQPRRIGGDRFRRAQLHHRGDGALLAQPSGERLHVFQPEGMKGGGNLSQQTIDEQHALAVQGHRGSGSEGSAAGPAFLRHPGTDGRSTRHYRGAQAASSQAAVAASSCGATSASTRAW